MNKKDFQTAPGVKFIAPVPPHCADIFSVEAQAFVATLHRAFNGRRKELLQARDLRQKQLDDGILPDFLPQTASIRDDPTWQGPVPAPGLVDRRVEITGPVDRKMVINALNSGATQFMADFEDSNAPTWENNVNGQVNLRDALLRTITYTAPNGKYYALRKDGKVATLLVRPRGWHLTEKHFLVDGEPSSGSLFDFGFFFYNSASAAVASGQGAYFYLPKMESHLEARLWADVFSLAADILKFPRSAIRATVLIETILASFEMDEIIWELREYSSGLNCGRWDYIFSFIKKFRNHPNYVLPDRADVGMTTKFMDSYVRLLIKTCHRRGVHAMGGMAAQIPIKNDTAANDVAMRKVRDDKLREVKAGHDGTWVAHPDLVKVALAIFNENMPQANQIYNRREDVFVSAGDLLDVSQIKGSITEKGVRGNLEVALTYMEAWLRGNGCVPIHNLMEDAATAEISRSQLWQWVRHHAKTAEGKVLTAELIQAWLNEEAAKIRASLGDAAYSKGKWELAKRYLSSTIGGKEYSDFLTSLCYDSIVVSDGKSKL